MKKFLFSTLATASLLMLIFTACEKEQATDPISDGSITTDGHYYTPTLEELTVVIDRAGYYTSIPAGSVDAMADAIANADPNGIIYLEAGEHIENDRVVVNKPLKIIGANGAVLKIASPNNDANLNPALYVHNAPGTCIQNLAIMPYAGGAYTGVVFDGSPYSALLSSSISGFPEGLVCDFSDFPAIINNTLTGTGGTDHGILILNAESAYIADNSISNYDLGTWLCDRYGTAQNNDLFNCNNGTLLCKYPAVFGATLPSSPDPVFAEFTCTLWKVKQNNFRDNNFSGLAIRDGANQNTIYANNLYSNNPLYDIVIPDDEDLGFLFIPKAFNNWIFATPDVLIQDCGEDNTINGGELSNDPC